MANVFLLNWRLTVHIISYMLLLLAQSLEEKVQKKHYQRIAQGQFGGRVNGSASGGDTYSPPLNDDFNLFEQ
jgi:hypothetical protein